MKKAMFFCMDRLPQETAHPYDYDGAGCLREAFQRPLNCPPIPWRIA